MRALALRDELVADHSVRRAHIQTHGCVARLAPQLHTRAKAVWERRDTIQFACRRRLLQQGKRPDRSTIVIDP